MKDYLSNFYDFLYIKKPIIPNLVILLSKNIFTHSGINKHFYYIKKKYDIFINKFNLNQTIYKHIELYYDKYLSELNNIANEIMELYMMILSLSTKKKTIIHAGLYHTENFIKNLKKYYNFKIIYQYGQNNIMENNISKSCVLLYDKLL